MVVIANQRNASNSQIYVDQRRTSREFSVNVLITATESLILPKVSDIIELLINYKNFTDS